MSASPCNLIGIIGGVGAGKSTLAHALAALTSVRLFDADRMGHAALQRDDVKHSLRNIFGDAIFDAAGEIQRSELAKRVFADHPAAKAARAELERIVHPVIHADLQAQISEARRRDEAEVLILDAPLLLEAGWASECDAIVFLETTLAERQRRVAKRGWSLEELARREANQWPLDQKRAHADLVLNGAETPAQLARTLLDWLRQRPVHAAPVLPESISTSRPSSTLSSPVLPSVPPEAATSQP